jgi:hypothetical protein
VAKCDEVPTLLADPGLDISDPQFFGQAECIAFVAFGSPVLSNTDNNEFLNMRQENFVQPVRVSSFLEAQPAVLGDCVEEIDQCLGAGLDDLGLQFPTTGPDDRSGAA